MQTFDGNQRDALAFRKATMQAVTLLEQDPAALAGYQAEAALLAEVDVEARLATDPADLAEIANAQRHLDGVRAW